MPISLPITNDSGQNPIVRTFDIVSLLHDTIPPTNRGIKWVVIVMKYNNIINIEQEQEVLSPLSHVLIYM